MKLSRKHLLGHAYDAVDRLEPVGPLDASTPVDVVLGLPARDAASRTALLEDLYTPTSSRFRRFLTPAEYADRFDPTEADHQRLLRFVQDQGFTVVSAVSRKFVHVRASADVVNRAFRTTLHRYRHPDEDRHFFAPGADADVAVDVPGLQITGLHDFWVPRRARNLWTGAKTTTTTTTTTAADKSAVAAGGSGQGGLYTGLDFRAAYAPGVTRTGKGQVVGVLELDGYAEDDIRAYEQQNGLPAVPLQNVYLDGYRGDDPNLESAADIELVVSMAPGLRQVTVYGVAYSVPHIVDVLHEMASPTRGEPLPAQITTSYYFFYDQNVYDALARLAAQGQALFVASGDYGAYNEQTGAGAFPPVDHPLVTSVGGTELVTSGPRGAWVSESAASFGGGGYSPWGPPEFALPWWQTGVDYRASGGSTTARNAPDVAAVADRISVFSGGAWRGFAGTSASAPLWAGFLALANEQAAATGRPPVGFANPALWEIGRTGGAQYAGCFHDVVVGNNFNAANPTRYAAVAGYDLCTGWGTPRGQALIDALARSRGGATTPPRSDSAAWMATNAAGRIELFAGGSDGALWHVWQTVVNGGWSAWYSHGTPPKTRLGGSPVVGRNLDGRLQVFVRGADGALWYVAQVVAGGGWGAWTSLGAPPSTGITDSAVVAPNADGRLEIFVQGADGALWHVWQTAANNEGSWSAWASLGRPPASQIQGSLCVAPSQDGRLEVFAIGLDGALWHVWQTAVNGGWSAWFSHGTPPGQDQTFAGSTIPPVAAAQADGRLHLFVPTLGGPLWRISQTAVNNGWSGWVSHGKPGSGSGGPGYLISDPPAIAANADGRLELFVPAQVGVWHIWQTAVDGGWSEWFDQVPGAPQPTDGSVALAANADGRLELAMLGSDRAIWHMWQTAVNNGWSAPSSYGKPAKVEFEAHR